MEASLALFSLLSVIAHALHTGMLTLHVWLTGNKASHQLFRETSFCAEPLLSTEKSITLNHDASVLNVVLNEYSDMTQFLEIETQLVTVEPLYNEVLGTMKITLLYQVSYYIRVKNTKKYKELGPAKLPRYKRILFYPTSL